MVAPNSGGRSSPPQPPGEGALTTPKPLTSEGSKPWSDDPVGPPLTDSPLPRPHGRGAEGRDEVPRPNGRGKKRTPRPNGKGDTAGDAKDKVPDQATEAMDVDQRPFVESNIDRRKRRKEVIRQKKEAERALLHEVLLSTNSRRKTFLSRAGTTEYNAEKLLAFFPLRDALQHLQENPGAELRKKVFDLAVQLTRPRKGAVKRKAPSSQASKSKAPDSRKEAPSSQAPKSRTQDSRKEAAKKPTPSSSGRTAPSTSYAAAAAKAAVPPAVPEEPKDDEAMEVDNGVKDGDALEDPNAAPPDRVTYADRTKGVARANEPWLLWICSGGGERLAVSHTTWMRFLRKWIGYQHKLRDAEKQPPNIKWYGYGRDCGYLAAETEQDMLDTMEAVKGIHLGNDVTLRAWRRNEFGRFLPMTTMLHGDLEFVPAQTATNSLALALKVPRSALKLRGCGPPLKSGARLLSVGAEDVAVKAIKDLGGRVNIGEGIMCTFHCFGERVDHRLTTTSSAPAAPPAPPPAPQPAPSGAAAKAGGKQPDTSQEKPPPPVQPATKSPAKGKD